MTARVRIVILLALVIAQVGIGSLAAYSHVAHSKPSPPDTPARGAAQVSNAAGMLQTALTQARRWKSDATLINDVSWLSWPATAPDPSKTGAPVNGWGTFVFASGGDRLAIVIDRGSGYILGQHLAALGTTPTTTLNSWKPPLTAEAATATAEGLGGRTYRAACPSHRNLTKVGAVEDPKTGSMAWVVTYADDRTASTPDIIVSIDAATGAAIQKSINLPSCEKS